MKTLIIAGSYKIVPYTKEENGITVHGSNVQYVVDLFGQTPDQPLMVYISGLKHLGQFESLQRACREKYCKYFNTDLNNIISMESLINIDALPSNSSVYPNA